MSFDEGFCPECRKELWTTKDNLVCPSCNGWKDITCAKIKLYRSLVIRVLEEISEISKKFFCLLSNLSK